MKFGLWNGILYLQAKIRRYLTVYFFRPLGGRGEVQ